MFMPHDKAVLPCDLPDIHEASEAYTRGSINTIGWLAASFVMGLLTAVLILCLPAHTSMTGISGASAGDVTASAVEPVK